jgi:lipoprotein-releasing system permease protein
MYKAHLILKYLRKRRIAWVSLIAVTLCTTMVLVVISVMGGWLRMFETGYHSLSGDIIIGTGQLKGFPYYEDVMAELDKLPFVKATAPVIQVVGLLDIGKQKRDPVLVLGYQADKMSRINGFADSLYYQHQQYVEASTQPSLSPSERQALLKKADEAARHASFDFSPLPPEIHAALAERRRNWPGMVVGSPLLLINKTRNGWEGRDLFKYELPVSLALFNVEESIRDESAISSKPYWIADDSHSGVYQQDMRTVYIPFEVAQIETGLVGREFTDQSKRKVVIPARTQQVQVKIADGTDLRQAKEQIQLVVDRVLDEARAKARAAGVPGRYLDTLVSVQTWREDKAEFIGAVEHEKVLVVILFAIISVVAVFLIFCIFYMIVVEKTRDIGIVKSVGATAEGVAIIFLGYGAVIGVLGGGIGLLLGYLIVHNINYIHALIARVIGVEVFNAKTYVFDTIPNTMDPTETTIIVGVAILSSILGALVPAIRAARMNPVEAVRYE